MADTAAVSNNDAAKDQIDERSEPNAQASDQNDAESQTGSQASWSDPFAGQATSTQPVLAKFAPTTLSGIAPAMNSSKRKGIKGGSALIFERRMR